MTPYELRLAAANHRTVASALETSADRLKVLADSFRNLLSGVSGQSREVWQGPAASKFEFEADGHDGTLEGQADRLYAIATDFYADASRRRLDADWCEREADRLEAEAAAAAAAASTTNPTNAAGTPTTTPSPSPSYF